MFIKARNSRPGFTLVEIIVVITILSVLFAMAAGAVFRAKATADKARVSTEIQQLAAAIGNFKSKYGVDYLPSRFRLRNRVVDYFPKTVQPASNNPGPDQLDTDCRNFLTRMFPRIDLLTNQLWAGTNPGDSVMLNGSECLVFFLGGKNGLDGFSTNPTAPWPAPNTRGTTSFEFDSSRIKISPFQATATPFALVYVDGFATGQNDQPYYYFTSYKAGNDYKSADAYWAAPSGPTALTPSWSPSSGVTGNLGTVRLAPFCDSAGRFYNPTGFQIISAGRDKQIGNFKPAGPGNFFVVWNNGDFMTAAANGGDILDNVCNFHSNEMGTPQ